MSNFILIAEEVLRTVSELKTENIYISIDNIISENNSLFIVFECLIVNQKLHIKFNLFISDINDKILIDRKTEELMNRIYSKTASIFK